MSHALPDAEGDPFAQTQYRNVKRLDAGGMGEVFVVVHRHLNRTFVAKILRAALTQHPQVVDRMRLEAQALGRLNHPNIVSVVGFGTSTDGRPFLVMEHLRGRTLRAEFEARGALPLAEAVAFTLELLAGLSAAHALGIVHRDIKPDNLFITAAPSGVRALKILDFGIARVLPGAPVAAPRPLALPTESGAVIGTPRFLSPEAAVGAKVDARADLYCAALVLYTALAGRGPFDHVQDRARVVQAHVSETPLPPSHFAPNHVPPALDELVLRALAKDPASRPPTAQAFAAELEALSQALNLVIPVETTSFPLPNPTRAERGAAPSAPELDHTRPLAAPHAPAATPSQRVSALIDPPPNPDPLTASVVQPKRPSIAVLAGVFLGAVVASAAAAAALVALIAGGN
jgi:serine/threonine-protein kinase